MEAVFTWKDVPQDSRRFTLAGETYPNTSPFDRLILDRHMRHVGDVAAIVAGRDEKCVNKALSLIKVDYEVLEPVLDFHKALDNPVVVHPEDNWELLCPLGADRMRNLCSHSESSNGDVDEVLKGCDVVIDRTYHTKPNQQCMMEPFCTWCSIDAMGRLNVVSSTQIVFHCRKIIAAALGIPNSKVHVSKPRIGGGFGAKQTSVSEIYPAFVTWKTKKPSMIVFTREECMTASSPRHEMELHVRVGASKDGTNPRHRSLYAFQHGRLRRARPHDRRPFGAQIHTNIQDRGLPFPLRRCIYKRNVSGRLQRLRSYPGYFCRGVGRERARRMPLIWIRWT